MASNGFRRLVDVDGKEFVFSCDKFNNVISKYQMKLKAQKGHKVSKLSIYEDLSNKLYVSLDAIINWARGRNGANLENIKRIAEYMQIDYRELLDTVEEYVQPSPTKEQDRKLVEEVFKKSLAVIVRKINFVPEDTEISKHIQHINNRERAIRELRDIHLYVNCHALSTSETIRNSLHRILLETEELIHDSIESWERFSKSEEEMDDRKSTLHHACISDSKGNERYELDSTTFMQRYYGCERRQVLGDDDVVGRIYIFDEIEFATDLGLDDVKNVDDEFNEIDLSNLKDVEKYGYHGILDVNPTMVYEHMLTKYLSSVYKIVFEDLF
jgi:transcriptional regulator with XRE-family HTH domain